MSEEKETGGKKTPPKKQQGNGRGAQSVQGTRGGRKPVSRADLDIPGPGEAGIEKLTDLRPQRPPDPPAAVGEEEPTVRFQKGQVPVKGPKPPKDQKTAKGAPGEACPRPRSGQPRKTTPKAEAVPAQEEGAKAPGAKASGQAGAKPREGARTGGQGQRPVRSSEGPAQPAGGGQTPRQPAGGGAPAQRGGGRPGQESRGSQPGSVRGRQAGTPPPPKSKAPRPPREPEEEKPRYTGRQLLLYRGYLALTILSAIIVAGYVGFRLFARAPEPDLPGFSRPPVVITTTDPSGNPVEVVDPFIPSSDRKPYFYTFLVVGVSQEEGGGLTDTMLLASYDVPNQKLSIMSLPRDIYVSESGRLLNSVYTRAGGGEDGMTALREQVQKLTGVYPDFGIQLQWEAVGELVDAIGGVYFDVPRDMHYWDPTQNLRINVDKGYQLLDGEAAMGVVRFRATYVDGDLGRIKVQQDFLKALISQCLQMDKLLSNLGSYIDIFQRNVETDLNINDLTYFATKALTGLDMDGLTIVTLPNKTPWEGCDHLVGVPREIVVTVNQHFNPYKTDIHLGELNVVTNIPKPTPSPSPTPDPDEEDPETSATPDPDESPEPSGRPGEGTVLPPEVTGTPKPSTRPTPAPDESAEPSSTPRPTPTPEPTPDPTPEPDPVFTPPPAPTDPPEEEEPLLPPGI